MVKLVKLLYGILYEKFFYENLCFYCAIIFRHIKYIPFEMFKLPIFILPSLILVCINSYFRPPGWAQENLKIGSILWSIYDVSRLHWWLNFSHWNTIAKGLAERNERLDWLPQIIMTDDNGWGIMVFVRASNTFGNTWSIGESLATLIWCAQEFRCRTVLNKLTLDKFVTVVL